MPPRPAPAPIEPSREVLSWTQHRLGQGPESERGVKIDFKRRKRKPLSPEQIDRLIGRLRIGDLNKLFGHRYGGGRTGYEFSDDDAGREDLVVLLQHYGFTNPHKMSQIIKLRAPWMEIDEVCRTLERVNTYSRKWRAETLGRELRVTNADRRLLALRTIAPFDMTPEERQQDRKVRNRLRMRLRRRTQGRKPRTEYLATSKSRVQPWEAEGISRRTWYYRQRKMDCTSVCAIRLSKAVHTPVQQSKPPSREEGGRATASGLARARPPSKSKLRVQSDAPARLMQKPEHRPVLGTCVRNKDMRCR